MDLANTVKAWVNVTTARMCLQMGLDTPGILDHANLAHTIKDNLDDLAFVKKQLESQIALLRLDRGAAQEAAARRLLAYQLTKGEG